MIKKRIKIVFNWIIAAFLCGSPLYAADNADKEGSLNKKESNLTLEVEQALAKIKPLQDIDNEDERTAKEASLKAEFLDLACRCQGSQQHRNDGLDSLCFIQASLLNKESREVSANDTQAGLADAASYDFGTMKEFWLRRDAGKKYVCVFSVDGGGIRGLIPALYFQWIEESLNDKMVQVGDLFGGTSVGGIIVSGFCSPRNLPAKDLVDLFAKNGNQIFPHGLWQTITTPFRYLGEVFFHSRYNPTPLEKLLETYFKDSQLHESTKPLVVTSIQTTNSQVAAQEFFFSSEDAKKNHAENYLFRDIGRATSAATTYFPAAEINSYDTTPRRFIDAGPTINNPSRLAYTQAKKLYPDKKIVVFSFGTGRPNNMSTIPADVGMARSAKKLILCIS